VPEPPTCPRCAYEPHENCQLCELIRTGKAPPDSVILIGVMVPRRKARTVLATWTAVLLGAWLFGVLASTLTQLFGAGAFVQFWLALVATFVGALATALLIDVYTGRRRLWGRQQPADRRPTKSAHRRGEMNNGRI
jgi:hypothetical protein